MLADSRAKMSKFVSDVSEMIVKEYYITILIKDMDISYFMVHSQQIEEAKLKENYGESKRERADDGDFYHSKSGGQGHSQFQKKFSTQSSSIVIDLKFTKDRCLTLNLK